MAELEKPTVFISHSRHDEELKDRLLTHLSVGPLKGAVEVWHDKDIQAGTDWRKEIEDAIDRAAVAVLLVTPDFLASDYASQVEIPAILKRREEKGTVILPLIAASCLWHEADWLRTLQVLPKDGTPLADMPNESREATLAQVAKAVLSSWESVIERSGKDEIEESPDAAVTIRQRPDIFISHCHEDGDFAEVLQSRLEGRGYRAWIDLERLNPGEDWRQNIDDGITKCAALVVVMSPDARQSDYVTYEWAFAWGKGVKVVPIMVKPTSLHPRLDTLQYLDFTNRAARPWAKLFHLCR